MTYEAFDLQVEDGLAHLTLNQPERGNPFDGTFCAEFCSIANALTGRDDVRAVLLRARGDYFSVGGDIREFARHLDVLPGRINEWTSTLHMGLARMARLDAPIVACVEGTAMGGAVAMIAGCDLVYSAERARFGAAYSHIGYSCDAGASFSLASRMGLARARRFLLLGEVVEAMEAERIGLVDFVHAPDAVYDAALSQARALANGPTRAYGEIRRIVARSLSRPLEAQLEEEARSLARVAASADAREGITAFTEKRKPHFIGR
ncbi:TPA: enoyl-CoA hydratase/isomerase family protein [Pseudomonas aeruginosa]|nr:enoyl-CoA hydratase/isomerase family protein [Pseudomonas aeruginosa]HEJ3161388.1 enoyl-CoA hydratase/isomerase family protein [Pseudomonas aeruginosa]